MPSDTDAAPFWDLQQLGDITLICLNQRLILGLEMVHSLRDALMALIATPDHHRLILDFTRVELFDSLFMSTLFQLVKRLRDCHGRLALTGLSPATSEIFASLPLHYAEILRFCADQDEARAWCAASSE